MGRRARVVAMTIACVLLCVSGARARALERGPPPNLNLAPALTRATGADATVDDARARAPSRPEVDVERAKRALWFAGAAYCKVGLGNWTCRYCERASATLTDVGVFEHDRKRVKAYAGYDKRSRRVVVAFRGTEPRSLYNWVENLDAAHSTLPSADAAAGEGRVHAGFQDAYASVRKQLISHLIKLRTKYERMWRHVEVEISGHSLGGALEHAGGGGVGGARFSSGKREHVRVTESRRSGVRELHRGKVRGSYAAMDARARRRPESASESARLPSRSDGGVSKRIGWLHSRRRNW